VIKEESSVEAHFALDEMTRVLMKLTEAELMNAVLDEILLLLQQFSHESETSTSVQ
jgi:citrate lyase alpha subunit